MKRSSRSILINYATPDFTAAQERNSTSAIKVGGFDDVRCFGPDALDYRFRMKNRELLAYKRGGGYWLWKPYIIEKALKEAKHGDIIFYCDSGSYFISSARPLIDLVNERQPIACFTTGLPEKEWSKRDALILLGGDKPEIIATNQRLSGFIVMYRNDYSIEFAHEFQKYILDKRIVSDDENVLGKPNYEGFRENRHDQTIFSVLTKKRLIPCYRDPSRGPEIFYSGIEHSDYPKIIELTRQRNPVSPPSFQRGISSTRRGLTRVRKLIKKMISTPS